ncbi:hypothetical protein C2G38_348456 [Gigaspora rosea]|uniref:Glycosyltransferase Family 25 protein n=1 Tax=Gigaspora rosea TaxID=44941 RepID=A0A397UDW2_9GLOM|nr:hypothetical protein C2G38_348456 [Gigaspora rosea]
MIVSKLKLIYIAITGIILVGIFLYQLLSYDIDIVSSKSEKPKCLNCTLGFDHIFLINLEYRIDRRRRTEALEKHLGLQFDYHKAVNKYDNIAISRVKEDDIDMELNIINILTDIYSHLPNDWDVFYVGHCGESWIEMTVANINDFELRKTSNPLCTHGYAVSASGARKLVKKLKIDNPTVGIDFELLELIHSGNIISYSINPPIIIQFKTFNDLSDISPGQFAMRLPLFNSTLLHLGYERDY